MHWRAMSWVTHSPSTKLHKLHLHDPICFVLWERQKNYIFIYHRSSYFMKRTEGQCEADTRRYREDQESTVKRVIFQAKVKKPSNHEKTRSKISSSTEEHDNFNLLRSFDSARRVSMISTKNVVKTIMKPRASFFKLLNMNLVRSRLYQQHSKQNSGSFTLQHKDAKQYTLY